MIIEKKQRKVSKHGVITTLGFPEGHLVTVARVDERTEIVSMESPERVEEMVVLLTRPQPQKQRHGALMERLQGKTSAPSLLPRNHSETELDEPLSEADADKCAYQRRGRRSF